MWQKFQFHQVHFNSFVFFQIFSIGKHKSRDHRKCPHQHCSWKGKEKELKEHLFYQHFGELPDSKKILKEEVLEAREIEFMKANENFKNGKNFPKLFHVVGEWINKPVESYAEVLEEFNLTERGVKFFFVTADTSICCCHY